MTNLQQRADLYAKAFPKFQPLYVTQTDRIEGLWIMGNNYTTKTNFYGAYPHGYLPRVMSMFPDKEKIAHLCSGSLPKSDDYLRVDINPDRCPDIVADAEKLSETIAPSSFDLILVDPPYSKEDAEHYGTVMLSRKKVLAECHKVLKPGGWVLWLDQVLPMFAKKNWHWGLAIGMIKSTNHRVRCVFGFEKR